MEASSSHPAGGSPRFIDEGYLELIEVIGQGAYGLVWRGIDSRYPGSPWRAVKALPRHGLDTRQRQFQRRELRLHSLASNHSSIITMDRIVEERDHVYVVMDFGEDGDLFKMICERQRYVGDDELIRSVFLQLLDGVAHIHNLGIAHRDIKPENIVSSNDGARVRICDFGLATAEVTSKDFGCGSTFYIAPECMGGWFPSNLPYKTKPGDVWSLGVILVNLVCGRNPWRVASTNDQSFRAYVSDPLFLRKILPISEECLHILKGIFTIDPAYRITLPELRRQILAVRSFSMSEEEVIRAHAAAQAKQHPVVPVKPLPEDSEMEEDAWVGEAEYSDEEEEEDDDDDDDDDAVPFDLEDVELCDEKIPSLRADSGSPSPPAERSRCSSFMSASLPPTPLLSAEDGIVNHAPIETNTKSWDDIFKRPTSSLHIRHDLPTSPDVITVGGPNPFFR